MDDSGYRAVPLASYRVVLVAAPALLSALQMDQFDDFATIMRLPRLGYPRLADLPLTDPAGTTLRYETAPADAPVTVDNAAVLRGFALLGQGVALLPQWLVQDDLDAGRLRQVLPGHQFAPQGVYALYPDTRHLPLKVRAFIDFMKAREAE
jgi:DNA-binding transcriptional LysR family regulator